MERPPVGKERLERGAVVARYELVERCGSGAMGAVWSARHVDLGHRVAIKFIHGSIDHDGLARARFEREARIVAILSEGSRHVARMMDYGVLPSGQPYLVTELLQGEGLDAILRRRPRLSFDEVVDIGLQLARALQVAHEAGVVHRDIKPANVFLCRKGDTTTVKLLDFGIAKAAALPDDPLCTVKGGALGTPNYMSPELLGDIAETDLRCDLWALAVVVYRMAVGQLPFGRHPLEELVVKILGEDPPAPTSIHAALPAAFDGWVRRALAKDPAKRFVSARELGDALASIGRPGAKLGEAIPEVTATALDEAPSMAGGRRRDTQLALAGMAVVALIAVGAAVHAARSSEAQGQTTSARPDLANAPTTSAAPPETAKAVSVASTATALATPSAAASTPLSAPPLVKKPASPARRTTPRSTGQDSVTRRAADGWSRRDEL